MRVEQLNKNKMQNSVIETLIKEFSEDSYSKLVIS